MHIIAGKYKKKALTAPKTEKVRPTTSQLRETLFNICQLSIEGARFLDLFAGSGAIGLEALSRGASYAAFVETNRLALAAIKKNINSLQADQQCDVYARDVFKTLQFFYDRGEEFDIVYADPPYGEGLGALLLDFLDRCPVLSKEGLLFIEDSSLEEPPLKHLQRIRERKVGRAHLYEYHFNTRFL